VNISYHIPSEIKESIHRYMKEHSELIGTPRLTAKLRKLTHELKSDPTGWTREKVALYLDDEKKSFSKQISSSKRQ